MEKNSSAIFNAGLFESFSPQLAGVTFSAGAAIGQRVVATMGKSERYAQVASQGDDLRFGEVDEGRVNPDVRAAFDGSFGGEVGYALERVDEFGAAIGIAGVIERVHADEDAGAFEDLGPCEGEGEKDRVAGRDIGDGDGLGHGFGSAAFRDGDIGGERR